MFSRQEDYVQKEDRLADFHARMKELSDKLETLREQWGEAHRLNDTERESDLLSQAKAVLADSRKVVDEFVALVKTRQKEEM